MAEAGSEDKTAERGDAFVFKDGIMSTEQLSQEFAAFVDDRVEETGFNKTVLQASRNRSELAESVSGAGEEEHAEMVAAWLQERLKTPLVRRVAASLFEVNETRRVSESYELVEVLRTKLQGVVQEAPAQSQGVLRKVAHDAIFVASHLYSGQAKAWLGAAAWHESLWQVTLPSFSVGDVEHAMLRDLDPSVMEPAEVREVVDTFTKSFWSHEEAVALEDFEDFEGFHVGIEPREGALMYSIGVLWGYALRGLVFRLALDRKLGTLPETAAATRQRLERQLGGEAGVSEEVDELRQILLDPAAASVGGSKAESPKPTRSTLLEYATAFFGHSDWIDLCKPADSTVSVLEDELAEIVPCLMFLSKDLDDEEDADLSWELDEGDPEMDEDGGSDSDSDSDDELDAEAIVELVQQDWEGFVHRAIAMGAYLADGEALVEAELGALGRGKRISARWASQLVRHRVLSSIRAPQAQRAAAGVMAPAQRLANALRRKVLPAKLRSARQGLENLMSNED